MTKQTSVEKTALDIRGVRYHESLKNLAPADIFYCRGNRILKKRSEIKLKTNELRKKKYYNEKVKN